MNYLGRTYLRGSIRLLRDDYLRHTVLSFLNGLCKRKTRRIENSLNADGPRTTLACDAVSGFQGLARCTASRQDAVGDKYQASAGPEYAVDLYYRCRVHNEIRGERRNDSGEGTIREGQGLCPRSGKFGDDVLLE